MAARFGPKMWLAWICAVVGSFALLEEAGFHRRWPGHHTLSQVMHRWLAALGRWVLRQLGVHPDDSNRWVGPAIFAAAWACLAVHFALIDADQEADAASTTT